MMTALANPIMERIADSGIVARADLELGANYDSIGRALGGLVRSRKLVRVGRGRYKLATGTAQASSATIAEAIERRVGRSTQVPTGRTLAVKEWARRRIGYDGNYVVLERA